MAKKTATYANYELRVEDNGKIVILNDGQLMQNAMGAIRNIAADVNFTLDPKWNTQSSGRKLIDFLNNSSASETTPASEFAPKSYACPVPESKPTTTPAPSTTQKPISSPAPKPVAKPAQPKNDNELTEEEMNELLKQIAELRKTIEALESRIAKLEKSSTGNPATKAVTPTGKDYQKDEFEIDLTSYVRDDDGSITKFWKSAKKVNYDTRYNSCYATLILSAGGKVANTRETAAHIWSWADSNHNKTFLLLTEMADEKGHKFSFNVPDQLPEDGKEQYKLLTSMNNELVKTFGKGGVAFIDSYMLKIDSNHIYMAGAEVMNDVVTYLSDATIIKREWNNEPFVDNFDWTEAERYEAIKKYVRSLKKRFA